MVVTLWFFRLKSQKSRVWLLLVASCYFYMSFIPEYILILGGTVVVDYFAGILIERNSDARRKLWLVMSLIVNVGVLAVFKYYNFFIDNVHTGMLLFGKSVTLPALKMLLPIGLSFHTFQAMSYTIEVYMENVPAERRFVNYAMYVMFYPQLVAGPIERPQNVLPQLSEFRPYNWDNVKEGLARMLWGFFKKVVIADRLAIIVDRCYVHTHESSSLALAAGAAFYYFQIYCDFSGYSDIALGAAKVMNIRLMENFNLPYLSRNLSDFWKRWHISLYSWFYDYLFTPLTFTFRRLKRAAIPIGVLIIFTLSGLWHGARWTFIVYGLIQGLALVYEYFTVGFRKRLFSIFPPGITKVLGYVITFGFVVFAEIFFRSETFMGAVAYIKRLFSFTGGSNYIGVNRVELLFTIVMIAIMILREKLAPRNLIRSNGLFYAFFGFMVVVCYFFGVFRENQFIYFQF